jgi:murein DD-endopeptidase MepM/ murein hydrolase activator NlpD
MPRIKHLLHGLVALTIVAVGSLSSHTAAACGTEWQGSTYPGHGSHNWNLDLNRAGDHHGSDLGQPLFAQGDGTVVWFEQTGYNRRAGTYVEIDYGDVTVRYLHLVSGSIPDDVAEIGARVTQGQRIGEVGATGRVSGPHLHLEYWDSAGSVDTPWHQLPRENHLPIEFDGQPMVATPRQPSDVSESTNCAGDALGNPYAAFRRERLLLDVR